MHKVMRLMKENQMILLIVIIAALAMIETREGFSRREASGGFRCMTRQGELQCNTFEQNGENPKKFTCTKEGLCTVEGGGVFNLPSIKTGTVSETMDAVMVGLGYKKSPSDVGNEIQSGASKYANMVRNKLESR